MQQAYNEEEFQKDLESELDKFFPGCTINYSKGCFEWEVCGPKYRSFYKKHLKELEEFESNTDYHEVFRPR